jgi:hypothetical protein
MRPAGFSIGFLFALGAAATALAEGPAGSLSSRVLDRAASVGVGADALAPTLASIRGAADEGLPADLIADKALEGLAKGVSPDRLAQVTADLKARLENAAKIVSIAEPALADARTRIAVEHVAAQLNGMQDPQALTDLAHEVRGIDFVVFLTATRTVADLAREGLPAKEATSLVSRLARSSYSTEEIASLGGQLHAYRQEGGRDLAPFTGEVLRRAAQHQSLRGLVDPFGDSATPIRRAPSPDTNGLDAKPGERDVRGQTALEQISNGHAGEIPAVPVANQPRQP